MKVVEDDLGVRQLVRDGVHVRAVHVGADGFDRRAPAHIESIVEEAFERGLGAIARKSDHFAVDEIGEHGPVALAAPALVLIGTEVTGTTPPLRA